MFKHDNRPDIIVLRSGAIYLYNNVPFYSHYPVGRGGSAVGCAEHVRCAGSAKREGGMKWTGGACNFDVILHASRKIIYHRRPSTAADLPFFRKTP